MEDIIKKQKDGYKLVMYKKKWSNQIKYKQLPPPEYSWFTQITPEPLESYKYVYYSDLSDTYKLSSVYKPELDNYVIGISMDLRGEASNTNFCVFSHGWVGTNAQRQNEYYTPYFFSSSSTIENEGPIIWNGETYNYTVIEQSSLSSPTNGYTWNVAVNNSKYFYALCSKYVPNFGETQETIQATADACEGFQLAYYYNRLDDNGKYGQWYFPDYSFHDNWFYTRPFDSLKNIGVTVGENDATGAITGAILNTGSYNKYIRFTSKSNKTLIYSRKVYTKERSGLILMKALDTTKIIQP